jgi:WD40 repeat protein
MQTVRVEKLADKAVDVIDPLWSMVYPNTASSWSPDGQTGIFSLLPEAGGGLYLVTPATSKAVKIEIPGKLLAWQWLNISRQLLIWPSSGATGYRYDLDSTTLSAFKIDLAHSFEQPDTLWGGRLSPDDRLIALFGYERAIFDLTTGAQIRYLPHSATTAGNGGATEYFWHPGSDWLISVESTNPTRSTGDAAGVMRSDGSGRRELGICPGSRSCAGWLPTHVIPYLAPGSSTPVLQEPVETLVHENTVLGAAWSPDGQQIASFTERDQLLHLWQMNIPSGERPGDKIVRGLSPCGEWMAPCHLSWRPDGQELALADGFNKAQIWMLEGNTIALQADDWGLWMPDGSYRVVDVFPSPNGKFLARGKDTIDILDASDRRVLWQFPRSAGNGAAFPTQFAWTPDSRRLVVSGFFDVEPLLWDVEAGQLIPLEQSFPVSDLALSPDGRLLAGISYLAPIHIWDTATGKLLAQLNRCGHAVTFSPDGKRLASAGLRGLYIWDISKPIP